jgi:hypothetical protein
VPSQQALHRADERHLQHPRALLRSRRRRRRHLHPHVAHHWRQLSTTLAALVHTRTGRLLLLCGLAIQGRQLRRRPLLLLSLRLPLAQVAGQVQLHERRQAAALALAAGRRVCRRWLLLLLLLVCAHSLVTARLLRLPRAHHVGHVLRRPRVLCVGCRCWQAASYALKLLALLLPLLLCGRGLADRVAGCLAVRGTVGEPRTPQRRVA